MWQNIRAAVAVWAVYTTLNYTRKLKELNINVIFMSDGIDTNDKDGELRLTIVNQPNSNQTHSNQIRYNNIKGSANPIDSPNL